MTGRRIALPAALAAAAVAAAGVAAATHHAQSTVAAAADFTAAQVSQSHTTTCSAADGSYQDTTATYSGTSTSASEPRLNGTLRIRAHSIVNTTSKLGWLEGSWRVRGTTAGSSGTIRAAIANGNVVGSVVGEGARPEAKLVASISAAFGQTSGFSSGKVGSGTAAGAGVLFARGDCRRAKPQPTNFVFKVHLTPGQVVPRANLDADATGSITLDLTRDAGGTITGGTVVFYVNYRFKGAVTITGLALHQGARGVNGPVVLDAAVGTVSDTDGHGNLTKVVTTAPASLLQALLTTPRGYYVDLSTSTATGGALRTQLAQPDRR